MILKEILRNTVSVKLVPFRTWIIGAAQLTSEMFPHTSLSKRVSAICPVWSGLPQQWLMTTWNKQTSTILARKPVGVIVQTRNITELQKGLYVNCRDFLSRSFRRQNWYYVAQLKTSSFPRHLLKPCLEKPKRGNLELEHASTGQQANLPSRSSAAKKWKSEGENALGNVICRVRRDSLSKKKALTCIYNNTGII